MANKTELFNPPKYYGEKADEIRKRLREDFPDKIKLDDFGMLWRTGFMSPFHIDLYVEDKGDLDIIVEEWCGETILHSLIERGEVESVRRMIYHGANINYTLNNDSVLFKKSSPLSMAVDRGEPEILELLLAGGADMNLYLESQDEQLSDIINKTRKQGNKKKASVKEEYERVAQILEKYGASICDGKPAGNRK